MDIIKKIKQLASRGPRRINAEAPPSLVERAIITRWGDTATIKRAPLRERENGERR